MLRLKTSSHHFANANVSCRFLSKRKTKIMNVGFSVNQHDEEGQVWSKCLLLHFGDNFIIKYKDLSELTDLIKQLKKIEKEVSNNYGLSNGS